MDWRERQDLDRYITGNWGEDSVPDDVVDATYGADKDDEPTDDWWPETIDEDSEEFDEEDDVEEFDDDDSDDEDID